MQLMRVWVVSLFTERNVTGVETGLVDRKTAALALQPR